MEKREPGQGGGEPLQGCDTDYGGAEFVTISILVLDALCYYALSRGCEYLWIPGLCAIPHNKDKEWTAKIHNLHYIFKTAQECVVLPDGLIDLPRIEQLRPSSVAIEYISSLRSTLEVLLPAQTCVLLRNEDTSTH